MNSVDPFRSSSWFFISCLLLLDDCNHHQNTATTAAVAADNAEQHFSQTLSNDMLELEAWLFMSSKVGVLYVYVFFFSEKRQVKLWHFVLFSEKTFTHSTFTHSRLCAILLLKIHGGSVVVRVFSEDRYSSPVSGWVTYFRSALSPSCSATVHTAVFRGGPTRRWWELPWIEVISSGVKT